MTALTKGLGEISSTELLDEELKNNLGIENYILTGNPSTGWSVTVEDKIYAVDVTGEVSKVNWIEDEDGSIQSLDGKIQLQIGDYIDYDPTDGGKTTKSYSALQGTYLERSTGKDGKMEFGTGAENSEPQVFTINSSTQWRVLGMENGHILLISADSVGSLTLGGQTGYEYGLEIIEGISEKYGYGTGAKKARAITVEDINKITGYVPETAKCDNGLVYGYGNEVTYKNNGNRITYQGTEASTEETESNLSTFRYFDGYTWTTLKTDNSVAYKCTRYNYYPDTLTAESSGSPINGISKDSREYNMLFDTTYWLGSKVMLTHPGYVFMGFRYVNGDAGGVFNNFLFASNSGADCYESGVRPVVYLKTNVQLEPGDEINHWAIVK